jgi:hypothetical protein
VFLDSTGDLGASGLINRQNSAFGTQCGKPALVFSGPSTLQWVETNPINISTGLTIQFEISTGCSGSSGLLPFAVFLQFTDNDQWASPSNVLSTSCLSTASCSTWNYFTPPGSFSTSSSSLTYSTAAPGAVYFHSFDYSNGWTRISLRIPPGNVRRRFRWSGSFFGTPQGTWAIANVYAGPLCSNLCSSFGFCQTDGSCVCDTGFAGDSCRPANTTVLPNVIRSTADTAMDTNLWPIISGGSIQGNTMTTPNSLLFNQPGTRRIVSTLMDATNCTFFELNLLYSSSSAFPLVVGYSTNNGAVWNRLLSINSVNSMSQYIFRLPSDAQVAGVRFMIWQVFYSSATSFPWVRDLMFLFLFERYPD